MRAFAARLAVAGVVALGVGLSPPVLANGRFPESQRLLEDPRDPNRLYLTATYGLLVSPDRGKSWYSICEQAFALAYLEGDPLLEVLADGTLVSGIYVSLNVSRDCGCGWQATLAAGDKENVTDLTVDPNGHLLAMVRDLTSGAHVRVHESADSGRTWTLLGNLPDVVNDAYTIDVAPSDPNRIYITAVTGMPQNPALLLASKDRGKTWTMTEIPGTSNAIQPFIAAVHRSNAERLFVRTDDWEGQGDTAAEDALLESGDGGKTWTEVLRKNAKLLGFALSPNGDTVLAGYGDPLQAGGRTANPDDFGIYKASATGLQFERIYQGTISCLRWTGQGLYACLVQNHPDVPTPGMSLGFAPNANFTMSSAAPFLSLLDVKKVKGPLACVAGQCGNWTTALEGAAAVCEQLEASCTVDTSQNVLACQGAGGAGGSGGTGGTGMGGATGTGGSGAAGGPDAGRDAPGGGGGGGGCGCALGPADVGAPVSGAHATAATVLASLFAAATIWRRRRSRTTLAPRPPPPPRTGLSRR